MSEAPGFMITMTNGRRFFIEREHWPGIEKGGNITLDGENVFELTIMPAGQGKINCMSGRVTKGPWQTTWIEIRGTAISTIEKVNTESFIWQSVLLAKSNLVPPNEQEVQEVQKSRQKFKEVK